MGNGILGGGSCGGKPTTPPKAPALVCPAPAALSLWFASEGGRTIGTRVDARLLAALDCMLPGAEFSSTGDVVAWAEARGDRFVERKGARSEDTWIEIGLAVFRGPVLLLLAPGDDGVGWRKGAAFLPISMLAGLDVEYADADSATPCSARIARWRVLSCVVLVAAPVP